MALCWARFKGSWAIKPASEYKLVELPYNVAQHLAYNTQLRCLMARLRYYFGVFNGLSMSVLLR
jgi:hypothetical protein